MDTKESVGNDEASRKVEKFEELGLKRRTRGYHPKYN
jgi:hypothetical protein